MSTFTIPNSQGQIRQVNRGDIYGELWATNNIDLTSSPGKIQTAKRLGRVMTSTELSDNDVQALAVHDGTYYMLNTEELFSNSNEDPTSSNWSAEAGTGSASGLSFGFESDMVSFDGALLLSQQTDIAKWISGGSFTKQWWTGISGTALTSDKPHIMHVHRTGVDTLFVLDGSNIRYYNSTAGHSTVPLESLYTASCIASGIDNVWVGTYNEIEGNAYVYKIQVGNTTASQAYKVDGRAVLSIDVIDDIPYIITERGQIQAFNGAGFTTVASFPFAYKSLLIDGVRPGLVQDTSISRAIHPKGMRAYNKSLFININTKNEYSSAFNNAVVDERSPSGIWELNTETGVLNHRYLIPGETTELGTHTLDRTSPILVVDNQYTKLLVAGEPTGSAGAIGLFGDSSDTPQSYFITPEIVAQTIQEAWDKVVIKADTLPASAEVTVKYRTSKNASYPYYDDVTWLNTTQFNTTDTTIGAADVGDEVEIMSGAYAGQMMHITAITGTSTFTVTVDESIGTLNDTSKIRVQNWKKIDSSYLTADGEYKSIGVNETTGWIQFKVVMSGDITIRQFINKGNAKTQLG